jgi:hypothetical protein
VRLNQLALWTRVLPRLGMANVLRVATYRLGVRTGVHPVRWRRGTVPEGPFYGSSPIPAVPVPPVTAWDTTASLFGRWTVPLSDGAPDWLADPVTGRRDPGFDRAWWQIPDFGVGTGDIKHIWEMSRMDWVLGFAQRARQGDAESLNRLNSWLADWSEQNPPYRGPNWKCGQEASIRVLHLAMGALVLGQQRRPLPGLRDLVYLHLKRIAPTLQYGVGQDNNHGTSEAAALFIGGSWLRAAGVPRGARWEAAGRRWLENRTSRLIGEHGTFSQYSLNYHRVLLDTLSMVEVWRRTFGLPQFSGRWQERGAAASHWLYRMISLEGGDGPNVGANDGANLLPLADTDYRDYRGSVQLAMALFADSRAYAGKGTWNHGLAWLGVPVPETLAPEPASHVADDGGFAVLRRGTAMALLRYPRFRFRPSQSDILHLDLWIGGCNVLRDAGSYSYNTDSHWLRYFAGTASHNTVQFDDRDQMPRLGRFLFGEWLEPTVVEMLAEDEHTSSAGAAYRDREGATHHRRVRLSRGSLRVSDEVGGVARKAVLRWRLAPGRWRLHKEGPSAVQVDQSELNGVRLAVRSSVPMDRAELVEGWESRYYTEKTPVPVLEIEIREPGTLSTEVTWRS